MLHCGLNATHSEKSPLRHAARLSLRLMYVTNLADWGSECKSGAGSGFHLRALEQVY
jgi:hypothetical protein